MANDIETPEQFASTLIAGHLQAEWLIEQRDAAIREPLERRVRELEGQVRWFVEKAADEKLDGYRELGQRAADAENRLDDARRRIASLEAELAAAREEALREAIRFIRSESSASESIGKHEWARFGSWLANKLTEELPPPAAQKEPPLPASLTEEELARLEALEAAATPGPWETRILDCFWRVTGPDGEQAFDDGSACDEYNKECSNETRDFIIAMRNALPALLDSARAVRRVEAALAELADDEGLTRREAVILAALTATAEPTAGEER